MASVSIRLCAGVRAAARSAFTRVDASSTVRRWFCASRSSDGQRRTERIPALGLGLLKLDVFALETSRHLFGPAILPATCDR